MVELQRPAIAVSEDDVARVELPGQLRMVEIARYRHWQWSRIRQAAFANPASGTFGNARRNTLIGPGYTNVDLSLGKEFSLAERAKLEIRADAYNAFNHINYANPDANVGYSGGVLADSTAGTI